jgi:hypothetical protein
MARTPGATTRVWRRQPRARDRLWQSMRVLRRFTLPDLSATAEASETNAGNYIRGLLKSKYVAIVRPRQSGRKGGHVIYQLQRDTGPKAPRLQRDGNTYDPNEHHVYQGGIDQR